MLLSLPWIKIKKATSKNIEGKVNETENDNSKNSRKKFNSRYIKQKDYDDSKKFKKILNYYGNEKYKSKILAYLKRKVRIKASSTFRTDSNL